MKKLRIYIDTSIIGGCFDEEFSRESNLLVRMAASGQVILLISDILLAELKGAPDDVKEILQSLPSESLEAIRTAPESELLRDCYLESGVVSQRFLNDAHHVALATVVRADMIVSWNFKHLVHFEKMRGYNAVNLKEGYAPIEIHSPKEVTPHEEDQDL